MSLLHRAIPLQLERLAKLEGWASMALVGVSDPITLGLLLARCPRTRIAAVLVLPPPAENAIQRARQEAAAVRVRHLRRLYRARLTLLEAEPLEALALLELGGMTFDAIVLLHDAQRLAAAWGARARDSGALLGLDHRRLEVRAWLDATMPGWTKLRDGLWRAAAHRPAPTLQDTPRRRGRPRKERPHEELPAHGLGLEQEAAQGHEAERAAAAA
jgi:hypothetical protein